MRYRSVIRTPFPTTLEVAGALGGTASDVRRVERLLKAVGYVGGKRRARGAQSAKHANRKKSKA